MHIAFVLPDLSGGGAERSVLSLARGLLNHRHAVDLVLARARIHYPGEVPDGVRMFVMKNETDERTDDGAGEMLKRVVKLHELSGWMDWARMAHALRWDPRCVPHRGVLRRTRALIGYLDREEPDCVLPALPQPIAATLLARRLARKPPPVVPTIRNFVSSRPPRVQRRYRRLFPNASHFVGVSEGVSDDFAATIGVPRSRITTIYNPVVTPDLPVKMMEPPGHPWFLDGGAPVILAAGRLVEQKDYPTLVRAFARVVTNRPCRLIIVGEGEARPALEGLVRRLKLVDHVSLPGWVENPFALMSRASLFVLSSRHEGLPGVLVQALACGCPSISTDCPAGPAEILDRGKYGPLVPVGDDLRLAEAMEQSLDRPPEADRLRNRAAYFSVERAVAAYEELLSTLVSSKVAHSAH